MASGHVNRANRPNTWLLRPSLPTCPSTHGPKEWRHQNITGCHLHAFDLNHRYAPNEMLRGTLPIALPLEVSPVNFNALLDFAKKELGINNIEWLGVPPWEPILL
jgi:hypothetical protein